MSVGFVVKISSTLAAILFVGLGVTGLLSLHTFERTLGEFLSTRFEFVVGDIRQRIETQLDLGLELASTENIPESMLAYVRNDEQIYTIEVFDASGTVIHSTDTSFEGDLVTEEWIRAWQEADEDGVWALLQRDAGVVGVELRNSFNQNVGSVALRYSRQFLDDSVADRASNLMAVGATNVMIIMALAIFGCMVILRNPLRDLDDLRLALASMTEWVGKRGDGAQPVDTPIRSADFRSFADAVSRAHETLDDARDEMHQIDEEEAGRS